MPFLGNLFLKKLLRFFYPPFLLAFFFFSFSYTLLFADQKTYSPDFNEALGKINESFSGNPDKVVLLVQDAHCNFEAQWNTVEILNSLAEVKPIPLIGLEGAQGDFQEDLFSKDSNARAVQDITYGFLKDCRLTGPEFFVVNSDLAKKTELWGVEKREVYLENLEAFRKAYRAHEAFAPFLSQLYENVEQLKKKIFSDEMLALDEKVQGYEQGEILFKEYFLSVMSFAQSAGKRIPDFPTLQEQEQAFALEAKIDFDALEIERSKLVDALNRDLSSEVSSKLLSQTLQFKMNRCSSLSYYDFLKGLMDEKKLDLKDFPNVSLYYEYLHHLARVLEPQLFDELEKLVREMKTDLLKTVLSQELNQIDEKIALISRLVHFRISNAEFERFQKNENEFQWAGLIPALMKMADGQGIPLVFSDRLKDLDSVEALFKRFYEIALQRDQIMLDSALQRMDEKKTSMMTLVIGGFHTRGIAEKLKEKGISYFVITPKVARKNVPTPYFSILMNELSPLDEWLTQGSLLAVQVPLTMAENSFSEGRARSMRQLFVMLRTALEPFYQAEGLSPLDLQTAMLRAYGELARLREKLGTEKVWMSPPQIKVGANGENFVEIPVIYEVQDEKGQVSRRTSTVFLGRGEGAQTRVAAYSASRGLAAKRVSAGAVEGSLESGQGKISFSVYETPEKISTAQTGFRNQSLVSAFKDLGVTMDDAKAQALMDQLMTGEVTLGGLGKIFSDLGIALPLENLNQAMHAVDALYTAAVSAADFDIAARLYAELKVKFKDALAANAQVSSDLHNKERIAAGARIALQTKGALIASLYEKDFSSPTGIGLLTNLLFESLTVENGVVKGKPSLNAPEVIATIKNLIARVRGTPAEQTLRLALINLDESLDASLYAQARRNICSLFGLPSTAVVFVGANEVMAQKKAEESLTDAVYRAVAERAKIDAKNIVLFVESKEKLAGRLAKHLAFVIEKGGFGEAASFTEALVIVSEVRNLVGAGEGYEPPGDLVNALEKNLVRTGMSRERIIAALKGVAATGEMNLPPQPSLDAAKELNGLGDMESEVLGQSA